MIGGINTSGSKEQLSTCRYLYDYVCNCGLGEIFSKTHWLFVRLPHLKCIRLGSVRSSHLPFKMHYARSSLHVFAPTGA